MVSHTALIAELNTKIKSFDISIEKFQSFISSIDNNFEAEFSKIRNEIKSNIKDLNALITKTDSEQEKLHAQYLRLEEDLKRKLKETVAAIPVEVKTEKFDQSLILNEVFN